MGSPTPRSEPVGFGSYLDYTQDHEYERDSGLIALPVAGTTSSFSLIRLHGGIGFRRAKWHASRTGNPPVLPAEGNTSGDVLLSTTVRSLLPKPNAQNGGFDWDMDGVYEYVQVTPRKVGTDPFPTGDYPFPLQPQQANAVQYAYSAYIAGLIPPNPPDPAAAVVEGAALVITVVDNTYVWPFTSIPSIFSSNTLIGG